MKIRMRAFPVLLIYALSPLPSFASPPQPRDRADEVSPSGAVIFGVCKNLPVPPGYVIVGEFPQSGCSGSGKNAWHIGKPGPFEYVCKASPIPPAYAIFGDDHVVACPGGVPNAWFIALPDDSAIVCKVSPIPPGFAVLSDQQHIVACPGSVPNAVEIARF